MEHVNQTVDQPSSTLEYSDQSLAGDARWELVNRIVESSGFKRAAQLRAILLYVSKFAIQRPREQLREQDIALEALERRKNFDPAIDNIVRVQMTHLRRKLGEYFATEGQSETLEVAIPKGSYLPQFVKASSIPRVFPTARPQETTTGFPIAGSPFKAAAATHWALAAIAALLAILLYFVLLRERHATAIAAPPTPLVLAPMVQNKKDVMIVLPDTSLMVMQQFMSDEVDLSDYLSHDFPASALRKVSDPAAREVLEFISRKKTSSISEMEIGIAYAETLNKANVRTTLRYPRDLHVKDFAMGNVILIGSRRSNPWMGLFADRTTFRFVENPADHSYYFLNSKPQAGEQEKYVPDYDNKEATNYTDVALIPNPNDTGFTLLINGSDAQGNEAAARYLLDGKLPEPLLRALTAKNLGGFEIFLRGHHLQQEANDHFDVVAYRLKVN